LTCLALLARIPADSDWGRAKFIVPSELQMRASRFYLSWTTVPGATYYQVQKSHGGAALTDLYFSEIHPWEKDDLLGDWESAVYTVVAKAPDKTDSPPSNAVVATRAPFTNRSLQGGAVVGVDIGELRKAIDAIRVAAGLTALWTSCAPATGMINASDIVQMRDALANARDQLRVKFGVPAPGLGETASSPLAVKAIHLDNLRSALQ
jgi:hypothetical protein